MSLDAYYENRKRTPSEQEAWDSFEAAYDLAAEHFVNRPIKKIEMNSSTRDKLFGGSCDSIWGADVIVNDNIGEKNVIFEADDNDFNFFDYTD
jgi:hypothetical protein